ncbi:unnamed protein product [Moneuplotes crassus]|uniref:Arrestin C-terminal-like domain-containing protein n=2 Tax=Euplotes crassus TaxID=5936 RepID=A0AAD1XG43_EUPCR|nr:unnamed protein product [Moneuplotes crassus]
MGNINDRPRFEHGDIYLELHLPYAVSGERFTGNVHINLSQPYPVKALDIGIKGKEKIRWDRRRTTTDTFETERVWKSDEPIFKIFEIYQFEDAVALPGQYTIPFSILIPNGLPSSVYYSGRSNSKAVIDYSIKAIMRQPKGTMAKEMSFKSSLTMLEEPPHISQSISDSVEAPIMSGCGCVNNGTVKFRVRFPKDSYAINEVCNLQCSVDNSQCNLPVQSIRVKIKQYVNLRGPLWHTLDRSYTKLEKDCDGVEANQSTGEFGRNISIDLSSIPGTINEGIFHGIVTDLDEERELTEYIQPSTNGKYTTISYILSVKLIYNVECGEAPGCEIPLYIHAAKLPPQNLIQAPEGWNPVILGDEQYGLPVDPPEGLLIQDEHSDISLQAPLPAADFPAHPAAPLKQKKEGLEETLL